MPTINQLVRSERKKLTDKTNRRLLWNVLKDAAFVQGVYTTTPKNLTLL